MMDRKSYPAEGLLPAGGYTKAELEEAACSGRILEGRALLCDEHCTLHVDLGCAVGRMPREECALGIAEGRVRDIAVLTRVGRQVCCRVTGFEGETPLLSRRAVQQETSERYLAHLRPGDIIPCTVTRTAAFGAFVDVGSGIPSLIPIDNISVSRISHPADRLRDGMQIRAVVRQVEEETGRLHLSHKELLGTWEQNAALFSPGQTVPGLIRSIESYGVFIELTPNLTGLAERQEGLTVGETAVVYIKSILPDRMKIKLLIA
ncbi:MAG: S1 RNA-binding domain-containing protein, partial [Clostridia bacterium]|nr:S1 RNA-binding domain-containing protein [Clostridia bacterium]